MPSSDDLSTDDDTESLILRWSDEADVAHEGEVLLIERQPFEATVSAGFKVPDQTRVYLIAKHYKQSGVVRSCRAQGRRFIVSLRLDPVDRVPPRSQDRDPGVFAIEDFLTEEQELAILREVEQELQGGSS